MDTLAIDKLLSQLRASAELAKGGMRPAAETPAQADFARVLKDSLDGVNRAQQGAADLARGFETGAPGVQLQDVMISMQKANISFQAVVQVRNRLVSAYHDIMNMQV